MVAVAAPWAAPPRCTAETASRHPAYDTCHMRSPYRDQVVILGVQPSNGAHDSSARVACGARVPARTTPERAGSSWRPSSGKNPHAAASRFNVDRHGEIRASGRDRERSLGSVIRSPHGDGIAAAVHRRNQQARGRYQQREQRDELHQTHNP